MNASSHSPEHLLASITSTSSNLQLASSHDFCHNDSDIVRLSPAVPQSVLLCILRKRSVSVAILGHKPAATVQCASPTKQAHPHARPQTQGVVSPGVGAAGIGDVAGQVGRVADSPVNAFYCAGG